MFLYVNSNLFFEKMKMVCVFLFLDLEEEELEWYNCDLESSWWKARKYSPFSTIYENSVGLPGNFGNKSSYYL